MGFLCVQMYVTSCLCMFLLLLFLWFFLFSICLFCLSWFLFYFISSSFFLDACFPQEGRVCAAGHVRGAADGPWLQGDGPLGGQSLMGESPLIKALRSQSPECLLLLLCLHLCVLLSFSGIWYAVNVRWSVYLMEHPVLLGILTCGSLWRWFLPKLCCLIDNNNANLNSFVDKKKKQGSVT